MFINNKYNKWYFSIIEKAKSRKTGVEKHHIIPKSLDGNNSKENLVLLTYKEHFLVHWLLTKFTIGENRRKMLCALYYMTVQQNHPRVVTSWQFEIARKASFEKSKGQKRPDLAKINTETKKGKPNLGVSIARKGKPSWNKGIQYKQMIGRHWYNNGIISKMLYECPNNWQEGRIYERYTKRTFG